MSHDLPNDIKSEIELFADDVKLFFLSLSKEITQMNLNISFIGMVFRTQNLI